jgi:hypothetical protein
MIMNDRCQERFAGFSKIANGVREISLSDLPFTSSAFNAGSAELFEVARNMDTSVQMIQQYYGKQATASVFATILGD